MQPKATTLAFTKPNQQAMTFFRKILARGDTASTENSNFQSYTQQYAVAEQATKVRHRYRYQNTAKPKLLKPIVRFYPTLNITLELIKPELLFLPKLHQN